MHILVLLLICIPTLVKSTSIFVNSYECTNPNNKLGLCISLYACPTILRLFLNSPGRPADGSFLQQSSCVNGFGAWPFVCCSNDVAYSNQGDVTISRRRNLNLVASQEECTSNFHRSIAAWNLPDRQCQASILNDRYVVSSAWCITKSSGLPVHLGKLWPTHLAIEKIILHEKYTASADYKWEHDIGLLRVSTSIGFNAGVAPICLPSAVTGFENHKTGDTLLLPTIAGAYVNLRHVGTVTEKCNNNKQVSPNQFCLDDEYSRDYSTFQIGAPLLAKFNGAWVIYGIFSFLATDTCAVFTRVHDYEEWILKNIEP